MGVVASVDVGVAGSDGAPWAVAAVMMAAAAMAACLRLVVAAMLVAAELVTSGR